MHRPGIAFLLFLRSAHLLLRFYSMTASLGGFARSPDRTLPLSWVSGGPALIQEHGCCGCSSAELALVFIE